jgi:hypothetical protein
MSASAPTLFDLLPAFYRVKDAEFVRAHNQLSPTEETDLQNLRALPPPLTTAQQEQLRLLTAKARGPLEALLEVIEEQLAVVAEDLNQFYDNQFIETCAPWVIPYIGDLIGYQSVHGVAPSVASPRAEVAHTISFRRRKGTILVLEQLARDVTGWGAHAVEFFKLLAVSQYMNHIRPFNRYAPDLHGWQPREYVGTGFDATAHTVDVRRIAIQRGRYNVQNVGIFLWSLTSLSVTKTLATPVAGSPNCFRFSSLGRDIPLFNRPLSQGANVTTAAHPRTCPTGCGVVFSARISATTTPRRRRFITATATISASPCTSAIQSSISQKSGCAISRATTASGTTCRRPPVPMTPPSILHSDASRCQKRHPPPPRFASPTVTASTRKSAAENTHGPAPSRRRRKPSSFGFPTIMPRSATRSRACPAAASSRSRTAIPIGSLTV